MYIYISIPTNIYVFYKFLYFLKIYIYYLIYIKFMYFSYTLFKNTIQISYIKGWNQANPTF